MLRLNSFMHWKKELSIIYEKGVLNEEYGGLRYEHPKITRGTVAPQTAGDGLSYKNNKLGVRSNNLGDESQAGNVPFGNPYEQNEEISIESIIDEEMSKLDNSSPTDRVAIMVLGKIKEKVKNGR